MRRPLPPASLFALVFFLVSLVFYSGCAAKPANTSPTPATTKGSPTTSATAANPSTTKSKATESSTAALRLKTVSILDQEGIRGEAFKLLIPTDWQSEGAVQWILDNPGMPAVSKLRVWNPKGTEQFQVLPNQPFFWTDNQMTFSLFPIGSKYFGNEVRPLAGPVQAIKEIVLPRFRGGVQGLRVVKEEEVPIPSTPGPGTQNYLQTSTRAGKVRVEYTENGRTYEDEIHCLVEATYYPIQGLGGTTTNVMWGVNYIGSFRAEKGKLDASARLFQTISGSVTLNLRWFNTYVQVVEYLIKMQIQQIKSIGQLGSIIAQTGSEIRQENLDLYNQRDAMNDRVSQQFTEYVRGVDTYYNPVEGKNVELPTGYDNAWVNNLGDYVLSDNPNYNPNVGGNQNFQRIELAKK
jgi:hypothetical protein